MDRAWTRWVGATGLSIALLAGGFASPLSGQETASSEPGLERHGGLTFQFRQAERPTVSGGEPLLGQYLGSGDGAGVGTLEGYTVEWDLYEDQSRKDTHPAHFRGVLERAGERSSFTILGVYTPAGSEMVTDPTGHETFRFWRLTGTLFFEDDGPFGERQALVTGTTDIATMTLTQTIWAERQ